MSDVISLRLDDGAKNRLDALSVKTGRSKAFYVREALRRYLDDMEYGSAAGFGDSPRQPE